jgi:hypothetical protein
MIIIVTCNWLQTRTEERGLEFLQNRKVPLESFVDMFLNVLQDHQILLMEGHAGFAVSLSLFLSLIRNSFRNVMIFYTCVAELEQTKIPDYAL